jgi:hypothetical protein
MLQHSHSFWYALRYMHGSAQHAVKSLEVVGICQSCKRRCLNPVSNTHASNTASEGYGCQHHSQCGPQLVTESPLSYIACSKMNKCQLSVPASCLISCQQISPQSQQEYSTHSISSPDHDDQNNDGKSSHSFSFRKLKSVLASPTLNFIQTYLKYSLHQAHVI